MRVVGGGGGKLLSGCSCRGGKWCRFGTWNHLVKTQGMGFGFGSDRETMRWIGELVVVGWWMV